MIEPVDPTIGEVVALWCSTFGEPPPVLVDPAQMLALIEAHGQAVGMGPASGAGWKSRV